MKLRELKDVRWALVAKSRAWKKLESWRDGMRDGWRREEIEMIVVENVGYGHGIVFEAAQVRMNGVLESRDIESDD